MSNKEIYEVSKNYPCSFSTVAWVHDQLPDKTILRHVLDLMYMNGIPFSAIKPFL